MTMVVMGILFISLLPILFQLLIRLRLGNAALADGIFFAMIGLVILSWVITAARKIYDMVANYREERAMVKLVIDRVKQARANGETIVNMDGLR